MSYGEASPLELTLPPRLKRKRRRQTLAGLPRRSAKREVGRYIFCATFLQVTLTGRYPAHCPAEFGLSSLPARTQAPWRETATV
jgi:hypothetical protein